MRHRKPKSLRVASSAENSTSGQRLRAWVTAWKAISRASSRLLWSLLSRWMSEVGHEGVDAGVGRPSRWPSSSARCPGGRARQRPATTADRASLAMAWTAAKSSSEATGKPASDHVHPEDLQLPGKAKLLVQIHAAAGRLLAVSQSSIEDDDPVHLDLLVHASR